MSTNLFNRQRVHAIVADLGIANMGTGNGAIAKLPLGAMVTDVKLVVTEAFDSETTATGTITDGTTAMVSAQDLKAAGSKTVAVGTKFFPDGGTLQFNLAQTGDDATKGRAIGVVQYIVLGEGETIQG